MEGGDGMGVVMNRGFGVEEEGEGEKEGAKSAGFMLDGLVCGVCVL